MSLVFRMSSSPGSAIDKLGKLEVDSVTLSLGAS